MKDTKPGINEIYSFFLSLVWMFNTFHFSLTWQVRSRVLLGALMHLPKSVLLKLATGTRLLYFPTFFYKRALL